MTSVATDTEAASASTASHSDWFRASLSRHARNGAHHDGDDDAPADGRGQMAPPVFFR